MDGEPSIRVDGGKQAKTTMLVCKFLLEDVVCQYECVRKIVEIKGEWNANEATKISKRLGVKLSLTITYNP